MIRINLLPRELQKAARTPVKLFATFLVGVALCLVGLCAYAYLWFNVVVLNERVERKHAEVEQLKKNASEVDALLDDIADYKEREKAIISIKTNRILWSRKLDELCRITPSYVWIVRLEMRELDPSEYKWDPKVIQTGGYLKLKCYSSGDEVERMTTYRQKLKSVDEFYLKFIEEPLKPENFYADFINITPPEWKFVLLKGYQNPNNIRFSVRLDLKPLFEKKAPPVKGAKA
jgi:Tfp pilus assembly protein PilN